MKVVIALAAGFVLGFAMADFLSTLQRDEMLAGPTASDSLATARVDAGSTRVAASGTGGVPSSATTSPAMTSPDATSRAPATESRTSPAAALPAPDSATRAAAPALNVDITLADTEDPNRMEVTMPEALPEELAAASVQPMDIAAASMTDAESEALERALRQGADTMMTDLPGGDQPAGEAGLLPHESRPSGAAGRP